MPRNRERGVSTVNALYVLFDRAEWRTARGDRWRSVDAATNGGRITARGALSGAQRRTSACLIVGTGRLARFMAHAHCASRDIDRLFIWGRSPDSAQALASVLKQEGLPAEAVDDLQRTVQRSHIVSCATTATSPVVHGAWLASGTHLDLVGAFKLNMREVDDDAVARSTRVRRHLRRRAGRSGRHHRADCARVSSRAATCEASCADLVTGRAPGRTEAGEITLFKSVGTAIEDLAAAQMLISAVVRN